MNGAGIPKWTRRTSAAAFPAFASIRRGVEGIQQGNKEIVSRSKWLNLNSAEYQAMRRTAMSLNHGH
jgi:hypothetical protein